MSQIQKQQIPKVHSLLVNHMSGHGNGKKGSVWSIPSWSLRSFIDFHRRITKGIVSSVAPALVDSAGQTSLTAHEHYPATAARPNVSHFGELPLTNPADHTIPSSHSGAHRNVMGKDADPDPAYGMLPEKKFILVIDDEASVREVTAEILREANVRTLEAEDGLVGLELFRKYSDQIVLVLLDFSMPGMNGGQVFEQMWKIDSSVPILFFSGYGQHETIRRFRRLGSVGFLQKPYTINELLLAVRQHLKRG